MRKIILVIVFCLFLAIGGIIFSIENFSSSKVNERSFIVVKGVGNNLYNYKYPFDKGTTASDILYVLEDQYKEPKEIWIRKNRKWEKVNGDQKIYYDTEIKVTN